MPLDVQLPNLQWMEGNPLSGYPLIAVDPQNTTKTWRFFMTDDDQDYPRMSARRASRITQSVETFNLETNAWEFVTHKILANNEWNGSSDDIIEASGLRNLSAYWVNFRINDGSTYVIKKNQEIRWRLGFVEL
jgi:hypothetical protein